jgi:uncharacterized protein YecT (DUF1311 family)
MEKPNNTTMWLVAGFGALLLIVLFFASRQSSNQDRLDDTANVTAPVETAAANLCSGKSVADSLKTALFARAIEKRGKDEDVYRQIAASSVVRMENAALEEDVTEGAACTATVAIDLPPGIVASGGRRNLMGDVDYLVASNGDGVALRNGPGLVEDLASLARSAGAITAPLDSPDLNTPDPLDVAPDASVDEAAPRVRADASPSFDCSKARSQSEQVVCSDNALAALDRQMAAQYGRAMAAATPDQQALLRQTRDRFLLYRDRCPTAQCMADAYNGRIREIADIVAGRWQPPR